MPKSDGQFGIEGYIQYLMDFMAHLYAEATRPVHTMAVCQPAPLVLAAVAILAEDEAPHCPTGMVLMGGPVDTRAAATAVTRVAESRTCNGSGAICCRVPARFGANRKVYPGSCNCAPSGR